MIRVQLILGRTHLIKHYVTLTEHKWDITPLDLARELLGDAVNAKAEIKK